MFLLFLLPLEADHVKVKNKEPINETDDEIRNSRSLVVDIHLPPASDDEEVEEKPPGNLYTVFLVVKLIYFEIFCKIY